MSVDVVTFGCRLNTYESEVMRREARPPGVDDAVDRQHLRRDRPKPCARRGRRSAAPSASSPDARIIVTGCAAQTEPRQFAAMPEVDRVLGNDGQARPRGLGGDAEKRRRRPTSWR